MMSPLLCAALVLLAIAAAFSEVVEVHPEAQEPIVHKLRDEEQDWQIHEAAVLAEPLVQQESDVPIPPLALSEQPRFRNQGRRRRKRPRPAVIEASDLSSAEPLREDFSSYHAYATDSSDERAQRPRSHRRRPYPPRFSPSQNEDHDALKYLQVSTDHEDGQPEQHIAFGKSNDGIAFPKRYTNNHEEPEVLSDNTPEVITDGTSSEGIFLSPPRSYRKPYKSRIRQEEDDTKATVSPQDIKALLKQHSGSLSLSEILQQKNLSLADLLRGSRNALNAITGGSQLDVSPSRDPNSPTRRLPPPEHRSRRKNLQPQKPHRYSGNVEQLAGEPPETRRLPSLNSPSRRLPSADSGTPVRHFNQDLRPGTGERVRFVPSNPRRRTTTTTTVDNLQEFSTESSGTTNTIDPVISEDDQNEYAPLAPFLNRKKKTEQNEEVKVASTEATSTHTASTVIYPAKETEISDVSTTKRPTRISLKMQESPAIDPLQSTKAAAINNEEIPENRLRGKHMPQYIPEEIINNNSIIKQDSPVNNDKPNTIMSVRPRLPAPSLILPGLKLIHESRSTTTESAVDTTTQENNFRSTSNPSTEKNILEQKESSDSFSESHIILPVTFVPAVYTTVANNADKYSVKTNDEPMKKIIPLPTDSSDSVLPPRATTAGDELLEFLKTETGASRLARILSLRNMSLAELIEHRERGSSQQHLAEIFKDTAATQPTASNEEMANNSSFYSNSLNNHIMLDVLKSFTALDNEKHSSDINIPSIQEMFSMPEDLKHSDKKHSHFHDSNDGENNHKEIVLTSIIPTNISQVSSESEVDSEEAQSILLSLREPRIYEHIPSFQSAPVRVSIKAGRHDPIWYQQPPNIYLNNPSTSYYANDESTTIIPKETDDRERILLLEDNGEVHEVTDITDNGIVESITNKYYNSIYRQATDRAEIPEGRIPNVVKSAIIVSAVILGLAILGFLVIFVVCRWRQKRARRRFVDGIANIRARSPILFQQEEKTNGPTLSPVLVNNRDLYQRELSEDEHINVGNRRYYLWRTIRKTLSYK